MVSFRTENRQRFTCAICFESYDNETRKPYSLVPCGHTFCARCIKELKGKCPNDGQLFNETIKNWEIIGALENNKDDFYDNLEKIRPSAPSYSPPEKRNYDDSFRSNLPPPVVAVKGTTVASPTSFQMKDLKQSESQTPQSTRIENSQENYSFMESTSTLQKVCALLVPFAFLPVCLVYPIVIIVFGVNNTDKCPVDQRIPAWAKAYGAVFICFFIFLAIGLIFVLLKGKSRPSMPVVAFFSFISFIPLVLTGLFLISWFFVGNVWVFSAYSKFQSKDATKSDYCDSTFFYFCFWSLIAPYILGLLACFAGCIVGCCCRAVCVKQC